MSEKNKPKRDEQGRFLGQPPWWNRKGRPKGSRNRITAEINHIIGLYGTRFLKQLFKRALEDLENNERHSPRVSLASAFMLKAMPSVKHVEYNEEVRHSFKFLMEFMDYTQQDKEEFIATGKLPPPREYADDS